ncbi:MAG TPA: DUF4388 domain-containing protein [Thermoanaerobaculia bacterium]|nr:DUF4388 domain-containing protein [Thermoanaerobaculia bacterium]
MAITGNLSTMQLAELLQWLSQGKKTGTLVIENDAVEKRIFFRDGRIISSASTDPREYLGQFLVSHGHITPEQLEEAMRLQQQTSMLLGKILTSRGAIEEEALHRLLRLKAEEAIYDIFTWSAGSFRFLDDELPEQVMVPINLDVTGIVLEGVRRLDEWGRIRQVIPTMEAIPVVFGALDDPKLPPGDRQVLAQIDERSSVAQIRDRTHATDFFVCRVLFEAVQARRIKVLVPPWAAEGVPGGGGAQGIDPDAVDARVLLDAAARHLEADRLEEALRRLRAAHALDPDSRAVRQEVEAGEERIRRILGDAGVVPAAVPRLATSLEELTASNLSRTEGFLLSRINGTYDIAAILKISSLPPLDAMLAVWNLMQAGHVELAAKPAGRRT